MLKKAGLLLGFFCCCTAAAQEIGACTVEDAAAYESCQTTCKATCDATYPGCVNPDTGILTLEEVRAAIAAECNCDTATNYGRYRSCVARLMSALRKFSLVEQTTRLAINEDNKACRAAIKARRGGGDGHGHGDGHNHD
jgi:hypothetical protein